MSRFSSVLTRGVVGAVLVLVLATQALASITVNGVTIESFNPIGGSATSTYGVTGHPIELTNSTDRDRRVVLRFSDDMGYGPDRIAAMRKVIEVPARSTVRTNLYTPALELGAISASVTVGGETGRDRLVLPGGGYTSGGWGSSTTTDAILLGTDIPVELLDAIEGLKASSGSRQTLTYAREPVTGMWPDNWLGYSRFHAVAVSSTEWARLTPGQQQALLLAVHTGMHLVVTGVDTPNELAPKVLTGREIRPEVAAYSRGIATLEHGLGRVYSLSEPRAATLLAGVLRDRLRLSDRRRSNPNPSSAESALPIETNRETPAAGLLVVLVIFTTLIGPVNLILLARKNKRVWLFLTTPALGLTFTVAVLAYGLLHDGISTQVRSRSVTVLDQGSGYATTMTDLAYYAPLTPGGGVRFDNSTVVAPALTGRWGETVSVSLDLTDGQRFLSGVVKPRIGAHLSLASATVRRERISLEPKEGGGYAILNGLGADLTRIVVRLGNSEGGEDYWTAEDIAAGARTTLRKSDPPGTDGLNDLSRALGSTRIASFHKRETGTNGRASAPPNGYYAVVSGPLFYDTGLKKYGEHDAQSIVLGTFGEGG